MKDSTEKSMLSEIKRVVKETKVSIENKFLEKIGFKTHDVRVSFSKKDKPLYIVDHLWESASMLNEGYWRVPIQPYQIHCNCVSKTIPVVKSITLFAKIPKKYNGNIQFIDTPSIHYCRWHYNYLSANEADSYNLPVLDNGVVKTVNFDEVNRIGPKPKKINEILSKAERQRESVLGALLAQKLSKQVSISNSSSSQIARDLKSLAHTVAITVSQLSVSIVITLDDLTCLPFKWDYKRQEFVKGFFTLGLTSV